MGGLPLMRNVFSLHVKVQLRHVTSILQTQRFSNPKAHNPIPKDPVNLI